MTLPLARQDWSLFLDFDGSIVELADTPEAVHVSPALRALLGRVQRALGGALAIVSGRPLRQIETYLEPLRLPVAGLHGLERRAADGTLEHPVHSAGPLAAVAARLEAFARAHPGVAVEDKGLAIALHYRLAPGHEALCRAAAEAAAHAAGAGFDVLPGKSVFEIKPAAASKGTAIAAFMAEAPFAGRQPVFCGDDVTDEDGFLVVNRMGGHSIKVDARRPTNARWCAASVGELVAWLEQIAGAMAEPGPAHRPAQ